MPYTPRVPIDLSPYQAVLLDLDGTIYHDEHPIPGAVELIRTLEARGKPFACLSNTTTSPQRVAARLERFGLSIPASHIYTAAAAAADYVLQRFPPRPRVFNLTSAGLHELLDGRVDWVESPTDDAGCDAVVAGTPTNTYATPDRQRAALLHLRRGAALVGVCADRVYPSPRGLEFGAGALSAMLAYAANIEPTFTGKPQTLFFQELCTRLKVSPQRCILLGDNPETDIKGAKGVGMNAVLVLTGITRREDLPALTPDVQPDAVVEDLTHVGLGTSP